MISTYPTWTYLFILSTWTGKFYGLLSLVNLSIRYCPSKAFLCSAWKPLEFKTSIGTLTSITLVSISFWVVKNQGSRSTAPAILPEVFLDYTAAQVAPPKECPQRIISVSFPSFSRIWSIIASKSWILVWSYACLRARFPWRVNSESL